MKMKLLKALFLITTLLFAFNTFKTYLKNKEAKNPDPKRRDRILAPPVKEIQKKKKEKALPRQTNINHSLPQNETYSEESLTTKDQNGQTPLMLAIAKGDTKRAKEIIEKLSLIDHDIDTKDNFGQTYLILASTDGHLEITEELLRRGADPNIQFNPLKMNLLMDAVIEGNENLVKLLLSYGANPHAKTKEGMTILHYAAREGLINMVSLFLNLSLDHQQKDIYGKTPKDYAKRNGFTEIVRILST